MQCCPGRTCWDDVFTEKTARRDLKRYRRRGPRKTTKMLLDRVGDVAGATVLDIGGGVGAIQHELLANGAAGVVNVDGSKAYQDAVRDVARERGTLDRIRFHYGDFVGLADEIAPADIVTLDLVICCYRRMQDLVARSAGRARRTYGIVIPRRRWLLRVGHRLANWFMRQKRTEYRVYLHRTQDVAAAAQAQGLELHYHERTFLLQVMVFVRPPA